MAMIKLDDTQVKAPLPEFVMRPTNQAVYNVLIEHGQSKITSILAANRASECEHSALQTLFRPSIADVDYHKLKDIDKAAERICQAYVDNEKLEIVSDFDVDGTSSAIVIKRALVQYMGFADENVGISVNNRLLFGYGFTEQALEHLIEKKDGDMPTLLITVDQGSNNNDTVKKYKQWMSKHKGIENCDVIITDHHHIDDGNACPDACAFVNPQRPDCAFEDSTICGCAVALFVMIVTREKMIEKGLLPNNAPSLFPLLTFACLATVADCVSLSSRINRFIVRVGLHDINIGANPQWRILKKHIKYFSGRVGADDLGYTLGPLINSDSRTGGDGSDAINFLLADNDDEAEKYYLALKERNEDRKVIDAHMQKDAFAQASHQYFELGRRGLCIYLPTGNHGVHGIVASKIKEAFECPVIIFSPVDVNKEATENDVITGSGRCIEGLNIVSIVKDSVAKHVDLVGGGHPAAMGLRIVLKDLTLFSAKFDEYVKQSATSIGMSTAFTPQIKIDHLFERQDLSLLDDLDLLDDLAVLEPYGIKFESPIFAINARILKMETFGKGQNAQAHANLIVLDEQGKQRRITVYFYEKCPWMTLCHNGADVQIAITLNYDAYRNKIGLLAVGIKEKESIALAS